MKVEITRATIAAGKPVAVGQVVDLDGETARFLIALGKAKIYQVMDHVSPKRKKTPRKKVAKG